MSHRVSASIILGGVVSGADFAILARLIADESLSVDWYGPWFEPAHYTPGKPLWVKPRDVLGGKFDELEAWCVANRVAFVRWHGACPALWTSGRVVFPGRGEPVRYWLDEDDTVLMDEAKYRLIAQRHLQIAHRIRLEFKTGSGRNLRRGLRRGLSKTSLKVRSRDDSTARENRQHLQVFIVN